MTFCHQQSGSILDEVENVKLTSISVFSMAIHPSFLDTKPLEYYRVLRRGKIESLFEVPLMHGIYIKYQRSQKILLSDQDISFSQSIGRQLMSNS